MEPTQAEIVMRNRLIPDDRIRTLNINVVHESEAPHEFIRQQMIQMCAQELVTKLFEHNKIKTVKREDGKYVHYISLDVIVPEKDS